MEGFLRVGEVSGIEGKTFQALNASINALVGRPVEIVVDQTRLRPEKSEVQQLLSANTLAQQYLGWQPQVALREGLTRTIAWIRDHLDLYRPTEYQI